MLSDKPKLKNYIRDIAVKSPLFIHKLATRIQIRRITNYIMSEKETVLCEQNPSKMENVVEVYKKRFPKEASNYKKKINKMFIENSYLASLSDEERHNTETDMFFCFFAYGTHADEYAFMHFYDRNKDWSSRREVVSETEQNIVRLCANDLTQAQLSDKARVYEVLKSFYKREVVVIDGEPDWQRFNTFVSLHPVFVLKRVYSSRGRGVELIDSNAIPNLKEFFRQLVKSGKVLLEERIEQSDEMAAFNPDSVNTARVSTFLTRHGVVTPWGFFRTGRIGSFIDNCAAGGVFASIDTITGKTNSCGCDESGNRYDVHPDSKIKMEGFQLPEWEQAIALISEAALRTPDIKYLSWDLAYSKQNGWDIVEVNTSGEFLQQVGPLKGIKEELSGILDQMDLLIPYKYIRDCKYDK